MKAANFHYHAPQSLQQALQALQAHQNAKALAGGQSLMPMMNFRIAQPDHLVDLNGVAGLAGIRVGSEGVDIGAMTRQCDVLASAPLQRTLPIVAEALGHVGHLQTRNRGTVGGSLCHADPAAEIPTVCLALDATLRVQSAVRPRDVAMRDWALGYLFTSIEADELLTAIHLPAWPAGHGWSFVEFARRHGDFAIVSVAALLALDTAGRAVRLAIAVGGYGDRPLRLPALEAALTGQRLDAPSIHAALGTAALVDEEPVADAYVSAEYRQHLARVLVRRALMTALARCRLGDAP